MAITKTDQQSLQTVKRLGVVRAGDFEALGIPRSRLYRLARQGLVERQGRGLYVASDHPYTESHALAQVAKRVPNAVVCLLTALQFHGLTTQLPYEVWIALPEKARRPYPDYPKLRVMRFTGRALTEGVEEHTIEGVKVRIYSAAKTVADCFKFRNKIGIDVAVEALKDFTRKYRGGATDLARFARICRVTRVMQPYMDAVLYRPPDTSRSREDCVRRHLPAEPGACIPQVEGNGSRWRRRFLRPQRSRKRAA